MLRDASEAPKLGRQLPLLGHMLGLRLDALRLLRRAQDQLGPIFWVNLGFGSEVLLCVDERGFEVFRDRRLDSSHLADFGRFLGHSMLVVDGADHKRMRGVSSKAFTPGGLTRARVGEIIAETVARRVESWRGRDRVAIVEDTKTLALEVIFRVMGIEVRALPAWSHWFSEFTLGALNFPVMLPGLPAWRAQKGRDWLEAKIRKIVADARAREDRESIVGVMVHGRDEAGEGMSEQELVDNLLVLGFAGHETTASTMAWSMLMLGRSPRRWDRLRDEVAALPEVPTDYASLAQLAPFAVAVFRESLRLNPPVTIDTRQAREVLEFGGYRIEPGTVVGASLLHISRDPARYPQPDAWRPERWLDLGHRPTPIENCQFGGGAHFCLGYHMALLEGTIFLVHAARTLAAWGRRPHLHGAMPKPVHLPLTQPPAGAELALI